MIRNVEANCDEPVLSQLRIKWNWLRLMLTSTTVDVTRPQRKRMTKEHLEKRLERKMWTAGFRFSWRKMETAAEDRAGWR